MRALRPPSACCEARRATLALVHEGRVGLSARPTTFSQAIGPPSRKTRRPFWNFRVRDFRLPIERREHGTCLVFKSAIRNRQSAIQMRLVATSRVPWIIRPPMQPVAIDASGPREAAAPGARSALILLLSINLFNYIDRFILAAVEPKISAELFSA